MQINVNLINFAKIDAKNGEIIIWLIHLNTLIRDDWALKTFIKLRVRAIFGQLVMLQNGKSFIVLAETDD